MVEIRKIGYLVVYILLAVGISPAANYYVTQSGAGSQGGTSLANAWSVANFNASSTPAGGDTVYFAGTITTTIAPAKSGTGNGAGRLVLDMSGATVGSISISGKAYLTIHGGTMSSSGDISCTTSASHDLTLENFTHTGTGSDAWFDVEGCSTTLVQNNTIDNVCSFVNEWNANLTGITILNNSARTAANITDQCDLINLANAVSVVIQGNKLTSRAPGSQSNSRHNDIIQTYEGGGSVHQTPSNWTISYNWIEEAVTDCADTDGSNSFTMIEGTGGTNYVYGNVFYTTSPCMFGNGMTIKAGSTSVPWYVYNNTFAFDAAYPGIWFQDSGHAYFSNNAFQMASGGGGVLQNSGWTWTANNNYFGDISGCNSAWVGTNGTCSPALPMFTSLSTPDLSPTNTLQNKGDSSIGSKYNQGIAEGATWPNPALVTRVAGAWDAGAYQAGSASSAPTSPTGLSALVQ
jgi:hypothetical protein